MADSRHSPRAVGVRPRTLMPPPALCGFVLLLAVVFSVSYAVGSATGPVAPGIHGTGAGGSGGGGSSGGSGGSGGGDTGGMSGMHGGGE
ncbi:hypothetical protein AB0E10_38570 [Streptomyces sp. NPDC048045]|uniref:hypothetical protein n=1 Tax=Streptomyces sp. NPDC048045 TaxID=3154710 RepID=UPI00341D8F84